MTNMDVVKCWYRGNKAKARHIFTDGRTIWSYGRHYPIALRIDHNTFLCNKESYSVTTNRHKSCVMSILRNEHNIHFCTTSELQNGTNGQNPVLITNFRHVNSFDEMIKEIKYYYKLNGKKRVTMKFIIKEFANIIQERKKQKEIENREKVEKSL